MEFTRDAYRGLDLEWFGVDCRGAIAIFTTGYGFIPKHVFASEERHQRLWEFFDTRPETSEAGAVVERAEAFLSEARRGLFAYFHSDYRVGEPYRLMAYPLTPMKIEDLPEEMQILLQPFLFAGLEFVSAPVIRVQEHFECE